MALVYSCCFWFSLRLGGILIGTFSLGLLILIGYCLAYTHSQSVIENITYLTNDLNIIYAKNYLEDFKSDPAKYLSLSISFSCVYIIVCILFIYGAYTCNNMLMISYILFELIRLVILFLLVATALLLIKQNTMDIGLLIGASVAGGFLLLGMFYLWICAANLPILINEMERDDQAAIINKLRQLLELHNQKTTTSGLDVPFGVGARHSDVLNREVFVIPRYKEQVNIGNNKLGIPKQNINNIY